MLFVTSIRLPLPSYVKNSEVLVLLSIILLTLSYSSYSYLIKFSPYTGIWINNFCVAERYDEYNINHKNYVIAETLSNIENVILFSIANYFREISSEIKRYYNIEHFENNWYEYVEYGTTSSLMITLQRNGYTRETAKYIIDYKDKYIDFKKTNSYANFSLNFNELIASKNENVKIETEDIAINIPELFINN